jgi:hypothetical protein
VVRGAGGGAWPHFSHTLPAVDDGTYPTPEEAAKHGMPHGITHVVETRLKADGETAYVLLAIEANPPGFYLDENIVYRSEDGTWWPGDSGGGFSDRTLADLRADPPAQGLFDGERLAWPG